MEHGRVPNKETNMKKLILALTIFFCLAFTGVANAWTINWQVIGGGDGVVLFYRALGAPTWTDLDIGNVATYDLDTLGLVAGTRYEFTLQVYVGAPPSYSGNSDIIRWTYPAPPVVIETITAPVQVTITINP